jgi:phosphate-selective porin OprO and OprP
MAEQMARHRPGDECVEPRASERNNGTQIALVGIIIGVCTGLLCCLPAQAQSPESRYVPPPHKFDPGPAPKPDEPFAVPDVPKTLQEAVFETPWLTVNPGLVLIGDYTAFSQDANSLVQVGRQENRAEFRAFRLVLLGRMGTDYQASYLLAVEYNGLDRDPNQNWELMDLAFTFPIGSPATKLTVGKTKETFDYEMVGDSANLPHSERVLNPFFVSRNIGAKVTHVIGEDQRMTISVGAFNDWWAKGDDYGDAGTDVTARMTGLLWDEKQGTRFLHLGLSGRYVGADNNTLRYRARPESNVSSYYVDTGDLPADHAWHIGLEALWNEGPYSVLAEYNRAWVNSPSTGDPQFHGYYVTASWILTGETRPYDRTVGYARRVMPTQRWGAPELVARFSCEDLDGGSVSGGKFYKTYFGINWWATRRAKAGIGWGHTWLDRFGTTGNTDSVLTRLQWIY